MRLSRWRDARVMVRGEIGNAPTINGSVATRREIGNALDISVKEDKYLYMKTSIFEIEAMLSI